MRKFWIVPLMHSVSNMIIINTNYHYHKNKRMLYRRKYHHSAHTTFEYISINAQHVLDNHNVRAYRLPTVCELFVHMTTYYVGYKAM